MHATSQPPPTAQPLDSMQSPATSVSAALRSIYMEARELLHDHLRLAALEARNAVRDLVIMIGLALGAALLAVTAWLGLVAAAVAWAIDPDVSPPLAFLGAAVVSVLAAVAAAFGIRYLGSRVMFAITLRWLRPTQPPPGTGNGSVP
jgi:uncharacterized membrane protein YqjE